MFLSGPSSFLDFVYIFLLFMLLPCLFFGGIIHSFFKDSIFYKTIIKINLLRKVLYYIVLAISSVLICILSFYIFGGI